MTARTPEPNTPKRAAIYLRLSRKPKRQAEARTTDGDQEDDEHRQETSLDTQEASCREYAAAQGYAISEEHVYREIHTRVELWEREQLTALREAVKRREVDIILCHAFDRLGVAEHLGVVVSESEYYGVGVESATEELDPTPEGALIRYIRGYAAKVEHEKIRERTQRAKLAYFRAGKRHPGAVPPYGYQWVDAGKQGVVPDPLTAPILQRLFAEAAAGKPLLAMARALSTDGIPTPSGRNSYWQESTVAHLLHNPLYKGTVIARRWLRRRVRGKWEQGVRPEEEQIPLPEWPVVPLVDEATWEEAQRQLTQNKRFARRLNDPEAFLLRGGLARCGTCGRPLHVQTSRVYRNPYFYYRCQAGLRDPAGCTYPGGITTHLLDRAVWEGDLDQGGSWPGAAGVLLTGPTVEHLRRRRRTADRAAERRAQIDRMVGQIDRQLANISRRVGLVEDDEAAAPLLTQLSDLTTQRKRLVQERGTLEPQREAPAPTRRRQEDWDKWRREAQATGLRNLSYNQRRAVLVVLGVEIHVWRKADQPRYTIVARGLE